MSLSPVILAGGSGTRLWPLSRENHPKQFLPLMGERSTFQETLTRLDGVDSAEPIVVCNEAHRFLVLDQMRELERQPLAVVVEPVGRNTAPALALAALRLAETTEGSDHDPVMLSMHADHVIRDVDAFQSAVLSGLPLAERGQLVTFGVAPTIPATGYGYIKKGGELGQAAWEVAGFVEKPDVETAKTFIDSGDYAWNSGLFMMKASVWLSRLKRDRPDIAAACSAATSNGHQDGDFYRPGAADFIACPSDSIDYAVMENVASNGGLSQAAVVDLDAGWSDIGAWAALWEERDHDADGNVVQGDVFSYATKNTLMLAQHRLLAAVGLEDMVVVETADAVLVARKEDVQDVKKVVERLRADGRTEHESHRKVHRPWGTYEVLDGGEGFQVKRMTVNPGAALSLQKHRHRSEHWVVVKGTAKVSSGDEQFSLSANESTYVRIGGTHRVENPGDAPLEIIEVQIGEYLGEDDIVRLEDNYRRA